LQTTTQSPPRARKQATAPFSTAAAKLIEQIQTEARAQLLADLSAKDAVTVLHGFDAASRLLEFYAESVWITDKHGNQLRMHRNRMLPESWADSPSMRANWNPSHWIGYQTLIDTNGNAWERSIPAHVCDDFGNLVQVAI
jgi:hypothetical protein